MKKRRMAYFQTTVDADLIAMAEDFDVSVNWIITQSVILAVEAWRRGSVNCTAELLIASIQRGEITQ